MSSSSKENVVLIFATVLITLGLLVLGAFGFWFYQENIVKKSVASPSPMASVVSQSPALMPSVESSPLVASSVPNPSVETKSDLELIKEALAGKYSKPVGDVDVNINKNTGTYASGGVRFAGEMGGGMWLAYKDGDNWIIVYDGHGTIPCEAVDPYGFPADIAPECWDETTGTLKTRT